MTRIGRNRMMAIMIAFGILLLIFVFRLYKLGGGTDSAAVAASRDSLTYRTVAEAARGELYDRNGKLLVANRPGYNLTLIDFVFLSGSDPNESLRTLLELCEEEGVSVTDHLPVSETAPYVFSEELPEVWLGYYRRFLDNRRWDHDLSATNLMKQLKKRYHIPEAWDAETARKVIAVRYELELRSFAPLDNYNLAEDVPVSLAAAVQEMSIPGVSVEVGSVREYASPYAAHILGRIGLMDPDEWTLYQPQGYAMNAKVGKDGAEKAFEAYLHGSDGTRITTVSRKGARLRSEFGKEPVAGSHVYLTLDLELQKAAEESLAATIADLHENGTGLHSEGKDAQGGSVVAIDCKTGGVLVSASYPTYDPKDYAELQTAEGSPLWNRPLLAVYSPGSIYKPVTAIAAIDKGGIGRYRTIYDAGRYTYYSAQNYVCFCHIFTSHGITHGTINMMQALSLSCNYYFYEVGREVGIGAIEEVAAALGLGEPTGIELEEAHNTSRANPETKKKLYADGYNDWYGADTLQASIGQSDNQFTPMQLAQYCATLACGGIRRRVTLLDHVEAWDHSQVLLQNEPEILSDAGLSDEAKLCLHDGMVLAATEGTASTYMHGLPFEVAAKTGTAQHGSGGSDNASFICYAPADDPQIAICVYVEKGAQGGTLGQVARAIMNAYFGLRDGEVSPFAAPVE